MKRNRSGAIGGAMIVAALFGAGSAMAQLSGAISDTALQEPWMQSKAVVLTLAEAIGSEADQAKRARIDQDLDALERDLVELQGQLELVAIGMATRIGYAYSAAQDSRELSVQIGKVEVDFAALYADMAVAQRADVVAAQASIVALREVLAKMRPFESDVDQAIGSGSKAAIQALAGRWWAASESVGETRAAVVGLRRQPA